MVIKYPGSKKRIAPWIVGQFPDGYEDMVYLEPYFGSGSVFFEKKPSLIETINDIDGEIVNLFKVLRERPGDLIRLISLTPWSRQEYEGCFEECGGGLEAARRTLVRSWISRGGSGLVYRSGVRFCKKYNGYKAGFSDILPEKITAAAYRLLHSKAGPVQIECRDAVDLIEAHNRKGVFMYLDPPYMRDTRNKNKIYKHEYYRKDHERLLKAVTESRAMILLSGYENPLYNQELAGWHKDAVTAFDEAGNKKAETVWRNYSVNRGYLFGEEPLRLEAL
jgi:DNA adenine methylase